MKAFEGLKKHLTAVALILVCAAPALAQERTGNGTGLAELEGFEDYRAESVKLNRAISAALELVRPIAVNGAYLPELTRLDEEIRYSKYILVPQDVSTEGNRSPGDYGVGTFLVASTEPNRGAPTKIYPTLISKISDSQMTQMVIHEAMHRALPEPMNGSEQLVEGLTNVITQYAPSVVLQTLRQRLEAMKGRSMPWPVNIENQGILTQSQYSKFRNALTDLSDKERIIESELASRIIIQVKYRTDEGAADNILFVYDRYRDIYYSTLMNDLSTKQIEDFILDKLARIQRDIAQ